MDTKPLIGITMGDPNGIGPEIIAKAVQSSEVLIEFTYSYRTWNANSRKLEKEKLTAM